MKSPNRTRSIAVAALFAAALASPGCLWAPELARVRRDIEHQVPDASFHKEVELSLGPVTMAFARLITAFIPSAREARGYLHDVSRVQVAVYDHSHIEATSELLRMPDKLRTLIDEGWETAVTVHDGNEHVWLLYRADNESIRDLFVVVLDDEQLVLVKARGHLERVMAYALKEAHGDHWFTKESETNDL